MEEISWAERVRAMQTQVLSQTLPAVEERLNKVDPPLSDNEKTIESQLAADTKNDLTKIRDSIDELAKLLGDSTTVGSIREWKAPITNNATLTGAQGKALADLLIKACQQNRAIARQTLRLARSIVRDYSSADVGTI